MRAPGEAISPSSCSDLWPQQPLPQIHLWANTLEPERQEMVQVMTLERRQESPGNEEKPSANPAIPRPPPKKHTHIHS